MIDIQKYCPDIYRLFNGKKICVVAGGPISEGSGSFIDSYDGLVVRLNNIHYHYPYSEKIIKDYGSRCDVLFRERHNLELIMDQIGDGTYADIVKKIGVNHVILYDIKGSAEEMVERLGSVIHPVECLRLSEDSGVLSEIKSFYNEMKFPTTGITAITAIASCQPACMDLFGFTFYHDILHENIYKSGENAEIPNTSSDPGYIHDHQFDLLFFATKLFWLCDMRPDSAMKKFIIQKLKNRIGIHE